MSKFSYPDMGQPLSTMPLSSIVIVLHRPQHVANIGGVVRAMHTMGFLHLRLVDPAPFTPSDILGIAHRSDDILNQVRIYPNLDAALADTRYVVGTSARMRSQHTITTNMQAVLTDIVAYADHGLVALLFGPEDNGLDSTALDRCHIVVRLPTNPEYPSLNLAQAALLLMYEIRLARVPMPPAERGRSMTPPPATASQLAALFRTWEQALDAVGFFKTNQRQTVMRPFRTLIYRARPGERETALLTAMAREVVKFVKRTS